MALKITFGNGKTYEVHNDTIVMPSGVANVRSRMEIHMAENAMKMDDFIALLSNEDNTMTMRHVKTDDEGKVIYDFTYTYYIAVSEIGKKRCDVVNVQTGEASSEYHLVAVMEQLTYQEQKLKELGVL